MNWFRHTGNIKAGLFILGITLISSLLFFTQSLVSQLREDNREIVKFYAELIAGAAAASDDTNLNFIFENIIKKVQFPIIQTDTRDVPQSWRNLRLDESHQADTNTVVRMMDTMDKQNQPIPLVFHLEESGESLTFGFLHYGDSKLIQRLILLPYFEIGAVAIFILLGFAGFTIIRNNEKRHIWIGMARETAHQLGTPVSALMGWIGLLKETPEKTAKIIPELETDVHRLEQVSDRFSKMGSTPTLSDVDISVMMNEIVTYFQRRLPSMGKNIKIENSIEKDAVIRANGTLLAWAIENVIKNGIDAIEGKSGIIHVRLRRSDQRVDIFIRDDGKGIHRKDRRNIFRPGFSTKSRGWGLGLSLTKRIIEEMHGGEIGIEESESGEGTEFRITLPQPRT